MALTVSFSLSSWQDGKTVNDELEVVEGMRFDRGYISPYFVTNIKGQFCELDNPLILVHDKKVSGLSSLIPVLEAVVKSNRALLIIAEDVESEALATLVVNRVRAGAKVWIFTSFLSLIVLATMMLEWAAASSSSSTTTTTTIL